MGALQMNTAQMEFKASGGAPSQTDKFITCLMEAHGAWVSLPQIVQAIGGYAAHSRAANAREMGYNIENKVEYDRATGTRHSFYRIVP